MCGILCLIYQNSTPTTGENIPLHSKVNEGYLMLQNRGPDQGIWVCAGKNVYAFRRLSIMGSGAGAKQPFRNENGDYLMCNGEIYNHVALCEKYNIDQTVMGGSDCECLLPLYEKIGFENMILELNGDFAIVLVTTEGFVYYARDRIGVRPLFMGTQQGGDSIAFASYARAIESWCTNVEHISPGWGYKNMTSGESAHNQYLNLLPRALSSDLDETYKHIRDTLISSVRDRLMSDRPVGCLLSGGLDSSLVASILCRLLGPWNVRTYSIGQVGSEDLKMANIAAEYLGTNHTEVTFSPEEGLASIPEVIRDLESYDITTVRASVGMWLLAKYISKHTKDIVLLSGEGSDELFCGYLYFHNAPSTRELGEESRRLVRNLYKYDVLRADRCISSHGLELRVPFLDRRLVDLCLNLPPQILKPKEHEGVRYEKHLLRAAFGGDQNYLPDEILWRRKDGMSDGISGNGKRWYEQISDYVDTLTDIPPIPNGYPSKESWYYKCIYDGIFKEYKPEIEWWLPKWTDHDGDPSGRLIEAFDGE
jgi:asparagine synthase (glutamine-hydrolysing)